MIESNTNSTNVELDKNKVIVEATEEEIFYVESIIEEQKGRKHYSAISNEDSIFNIATHLNITLREAHSLYHAVLQGEIKSQKLEDLVIIPKHYNLLTDKKN